MATKVVVPIKLPYMGPPKEGRAEVYPTKLAEFEAKQMGRKKGPVWDNPKTPVPYKNGGMVKMTPKSTPYMCGGKVK